MEKSKVMNNSTINIYKNGQKLEEVTSLKYPGATLCRDGTCLAEIRIRISSATAKLHRIWRSNTPSFASKFKLYESLITPILLYDCETWTLLADSEKRTQAVEIKCMRKLLCISYLDHKTNDCVRSKINFLVGP